jgi:hypothetical protein
MICYASMKCIVRFQFFTTVNSRNLPYTMKMETASYADTLVPISQTTLYHVTEVHGLATCYFSYNNNNSQGLMFQCA